MFVRGTDRRIYHRFYQPNVGLWSDYRDINFEADSEPSATSQGPGSAVVVAARWQGNRRGVSVKVHRDGEWHGPVWLGHPPLVSMSGAPTVANCCGFGVLVLSNGSDGNIYSAWVNPRRLNRPDEPYEWTRLPMPLPVVGGLAGSPVAVSRAEDSIDMFVVGANGHVYHAYRSSVMDAWRPEWFDIGCCALPGSKVAVATGD